MTGITFMSDAGRNPAPGMREAPSSFPEQDAARGGRDEGPRDLGRDLPPGVIRRLWRTDLEAFRAHLRRLDSETRRSRFSGGVSEAFLDDYAARALCSDGMILGYVLGDEVRGVAELQPFDHRPSHEAEAAFSVEAPYRKRGIGTALFRRLILSARNRSIRILHVRCLPHNRSMQALARRHGASLVFDRDDIVGRLETTTATPFSVAQEAWAESLALPLALFERRRAPFLGSPC